MPPPNPKPSQRDPRFHLLTGVVVFGFLVIAAGLIRLQIANHERYQILSRDNYVLPEVLRAPRGAIFDRNGVLLADSAPSFNIVFRPFPAESAHRALMVRSFGWVERVAAITELDTAVVKERVLFADRSGQTAVLQRNASFAMRAAVAELREQIPGVEVHVEPLRRYPFGDLAAHLLGYAGEINDRELASRATEGYRRGDLVGRSGIERSYEHILRGRNGTEFVIVNATGRRVATLGERPPAPALPGHDIVLTLDVAIQQAMEEAMADVRRGAAVAIDPRDGGILAMVSRPAIDPNEFSVGLSRDRWRELTRDGSDPLLNRAIQGVYPPGSTFKVVTMLAALKAGVAREDTRLAPCAGSYRFGNRSFRCWKRTGHGSLDFVGALEHSCDVYFYQIGLRLGLSRLGELAREFSMGHATGIDLPGEKGGLVPDQAWYDKNKRGWKGLMLNLAIGQGEILTTPLQVAVLLAEVARTGRPVQPHVVRGVRGDASFQEARASRGVIEAGAGHWQSVLVALERTVAQGTGTAAQVKGVRVAGKTGTAENPHGDDHAWFVCFAPVEDPVVAMAFVIENAGHGGSIAAPRARHVLQRIFLADSTQTDFRAPGHSAPAAPAPRDRSREAVGGPAAVAGVGGTRR